MVCATCGFPLTPRARFPRFGLKPVMRSCRLYTGCRVDREQASPALFRSIILAMPVLTASEPISMRHRRFACAQLLITHLTAWPAAFSPALTTTSLIRSSLEWFEACPCRPAPGGQLPSSTQLCRQIRTSYEIGVFDPAVTQCLVAQVVHVLEKRQARHQPRRQWRATGAIRIDRSALRLKKPPIRSRAKASPAHVTGQ